MYLLFVYSAAAFFDAAERRFPNSLLLLAAFPGGFLLGPAYLLRLLLLFALFLPLFRLRLLGGGDVKLLAVSGAYLGCGRFLWFFFFTLAAAAVPSAYLFLKGFRRTRIPLGPCFLVGYGLLSVLQPA